MDMEATTCTERNIRCQAVALHGRADLVVIVSGCTHDYEAAGSRNSCWCRDHHWMSVVVASVFILIGWYCSRSRQHKHGKKCLDHARMTFDRVDHLLINYHPSIKFAAIILFQCLFRIVLSSLIPHSSIMLLNLSGIYRIVCLQPGLAFIVCALMSLRSCPRDMQLRKLKTIRIGWVV